MNWKSDREAALKAGRAIVDGAKAAGRGLTDAERAEVEAHIKTADDLEARIKRAAEDGALRDRIDAMAPVEVHGAALEDMGEPKAALTRALAMKQPTGVRFGSKADLTAATITGVGLAPGVNPDPAEIPASPLALTDLSTLLQVQSVTAPEQVFYTVSKVAGVDVVPEGGLKPELSHAVEGRSVKLEKLAGWFRTSTEMGQDAQAIVQAILRQALADLTARENKVVLDAFAAAEGVTVLQTTAPGVLDTIADAVGTQVALNGVAPEFLAASPQDVANLRKMKASGSGEYLIDPFSNAAVGPMGLTVRAVPGMTPGKLWIGSRAAGTFFRHAGGVQVVSGYQNDDIVRNLVTTVVEERVAAAVTFPQYLTAVEVSSAQ